MRTEIQRNYSQVKQDVKDIVANEIERIKNDPELCHLLKKRNY